MNAYGFESIEEHFSAPSKAQWPILHRNFLMSPVTHFSESMICPCGVTLFDFNESVESHKMSPGTQFIGQYYSLLDY